MDATQCNIGEKGQNRRRLIGQVLVTLGVVLCFASRSTHLFGWVIAFFGFLSWFQALAGT